MLGSEQNSTPKQISAIQGLKILHFIKNVASMEVGCGRDKRLGKEWDQRHASKTCDDRILGAVGEVLICC